MIISIKQEHTQAPKNMLADLLFLMHLSLALRLSSKTRQAKPEQGDVTQHSTDSTMPTTARSLASPAMWVWSFEVLFVDASPAAAARAVAAASACAAAAAAATASVAAAAADKEDEESGAGEDGGELEVDEVEGGEFGVDVVCLVVLDSNGVSWPPPHAQQCSWARKSSVKVFP